MECVEVSGESDDEVCPFLDIPEEMFLYICSFLDIKDLVCSLSGVCKTFYEILRNENVYKTWIAAKWGRVYPSVSSVNHDKINWKRACFVLEKEWKMWSSTLKHSIIRDAHLSNADAAMFINNAKHCVTGSRDHYMALWSLNDSDENELNPKVVEMKKAHDGWVWRLRQSRDVILTASWDFTIKEWLWQEGFTEKNCLRSNAPVLCIVADSTGLIYGGTIRKVVQAFDSRVQCEPLFSLDGHRRSVLTLGTLGEDLISGSEDGSLIVWDLRMRKVKQRLHFDGCSYPINCEELNGVLYVGDSKGVVRSFSFNAGSLNADNSFTVGHSKLLTTVKVTNGSIVTAALDGAVRSHLSLSPPLYVGSVQTAGGEVSGMDYCRGKLVIGTASTVEFWTSE